nr:hypothetical protein GCM10020093_031680 [Planobispora longispora]
MAVEPLLEGGSGDLGVRCSGGGRAGVAGEVDQFLGHGAAGHELGGQAGMQATSPCRQSRSRPTNSWVTVRVEHGYATGVYHVRNPEKLSRVGRETAVDRGRGPSGGRRDVPSSDRQSAPRRFDPVG